MPQQLNISDPTLEKSRTGLDQDSGPHTRLSRSYVYAQNRKENRASIRKVGENSPLIAVAGRIIKAVAHKWCRKRSPQMRIDAPYRQCSWLHPF